LRARRIASGLPLGGLRRRAPGREQAQAELQSGDREEARPVGQRAARPSIYAVVPVDDSVYVRVLEDPGGPSAIGRSGMFGEQVLRAKSHVLPITNQWQTVSSKAAG